MNNNNLLFNELKSDENEQYDQEGDNIEKELHFYDFDEELGTEVCQMPMDQDEMSDWLSREEKRCPYFRFYDEYK